MSRDPRCMEMREILVELFSKHAELDAMCDEIQPGHFCGISARSAALRNEALRRMGDEPADGETSNQELLDSLIAVVSRSLNDMHESLSDRLERIKLTCKVNERVAEARKQPSLQTA